MLTVVALSGSGLRFVDYHRECEVGVQDQTISAQTAYIDLLSPSLYVIAIRALLQLLMWLQSFV